MKKFHSYVGKNPWERIEQIGMGLGVSPKTLVLPVKKLVGEKRIGTKGQKRVRSASEALTLCEHAL